MKEFSEFSEGISEFLYCSGTRDVSSGLELNSFEGVPRLSIFSHLLSFSSLFDGFINSEVSKQISSHLPNLENVWKSLVPKLLKIGTLSHMPCKISDGCSEFRFGEVIVDNSFHSKCILLPQKFFTFSKKIHVGWVLISLKKKHHVFKPFASGSSLSLCWQRTEFWQMVDEET
eukprot:TRINITY_DN5842_c0_g1_i3.p1 TRINITY_DN5842_c0_g1~~TRINITY_DN5842_c0_g1_i3.p1  ORF type:complete len:199 (-),score=30.69 TRINITY_DN5842_c0_g1_i3:191-709(-)